jgi:NAD(P)-dependent dehydrogenase (short-subunit alcohol dehydrogenase family)
MWQFLPRGQRDDLRRRVADALPVRRMGTPEDVAHAAVFLMTNPQVTGTVLEITGGETLINALE